MQPRTIDLLSWRRAAERGALLAAAGALSVVAAAAAFQPEAIPLLLGPEPAPHLFALLSIAATMPAGAEIGRHAVRLRTEPERRRRRVLLWSFLGYLSAVVIGAIAAIAAHAGLEVVLEDPYGAAARALVLALVLLPWGAVPLAATALALERWTRPYRRRSPPPEGGPGPGPGERAPASNVVALEARRRAEPGPVRRAA